MYLKGLTLKGFKSFPMKTDIFFEKGITAVVGPNGSGKSNVSDAIRWVLGEQSVKSLRGEKMEDVIFSGTDTKSEMNSCEVSLILDNSEGIIVGEKEIIVKRKAYRNGESEFYINRNKCRLKDVREILMDTGIGKDGYSIIEQGKVEEILSNNPATKKKIFDEACGIAKYRYKKNDAEKNLKKASDNLTRIVDIFSEIEGQIKPLERQQAKAKKFIEYRDELKIMEINDTINKNLSFQEEKKSFELSLNDIEREISILDSEKTQLEEEIDKTMIKSESIEQIIDNINDQLASISDSINNTNIEIKVTSEKIKNKENDIQQKKSDLKLIDDRINVDRIELEKSEKRIDENSYLIDTLQNELEAIFEDKLSAENKVNLTKKSIDDNKNLSIRLLEEKENISRNFATVNANIDNFCRRIKDVEAENDGLKLEIESSNDILKSKREDVEKIKIEIENNKANIDKLDNSILEIDRKISGLNRDIQNYNIEISAFQSKLNTYKEMEAQHEGFNKGVKEVLKNKNIKGIHGALGELISVSAVYEKAIEAALGASIQNVVVDSESTAKTAIEYLKKNNYGRVTFLPVNIMRGNKLSLDLSKFREKPIGICSDLLSYDKKYSEVMENILGRVIVMKDMDSAISFAKESGHKYRLVTLDGDILNAGGSMTGGSLKSTGSILSRKRIILELEQKIEKNKNDIGNLDNEISELKERLSSTEATKKDEMDLINEKEKALVSFSTEIKVEEDRVKTRVSKIDSNLAEISTIEKKLENEKKMFDEIEQTIQSLSEKNDDNTTVIADLESEILTHQKELEEFTKLFNDKNLILERNKNIFEMNINESNRIKASIEDSLEKKNELNSQVSAFEGEINSLDDMFANLNEKLTAYQIEHDDLSEKLSENKIEKDELKIDLDEKNTMLRQKTRSFSEYKDQKFKLDSKLERIIFGMDSLDEFLNEKYEMSFEQALELKDDDVVIDYVKIEKLKKSIKALGNVNLDSIEEYEEVKSRYDYYKEQKEDLEVSIESITKIIDDLTENMKVEFVENFHRINENFKKVYIKLFGGGNANLRITDDEDILGCDIEITAQPPGKKMKNLSLLSGGEKALTAICILFGILISKPTPFCILDEIEAPLDDVNVYRFGEYLKELSEDTQFISITHRRGTMEVADYIYGITMQEKGVSSVISMKLNDAVEIAE